MTQRKWETKDGWLVMTGWDRMLNYFFIDISKDCEDCVGDETCPKCYGEGTVFAYNNLDDNTLNMGAMTLDQVAAKMEEYLTFFPPQVLVDLGMDKIHHRGNVVARYGVIGEVKRH